MATIGDIRVRYPEFSDKVEYPDARIQLFLSDAVTIMGALGRWLVFYDIAQAALVAHLLTLADQTSGGDNGGGYPMRRQEVDDVKIENAIADVKASDSLIFSTMYGRTYYRYVRMEFTSILAV